MIVRMLSCGGYDCPEIIGKELDAIPYYNKLDKSLIGVAIKGYSIRYYLNGKDKKKFNANTNYHFINCLMHKNYEVIKDDICPRP